MTEEFSTKYFKIFKYYFNTVRNIIQYLIENSSVNIPHYSFLTPYSLLLALCSLLFALCSLLFAPCSLLLAPCSLLLAPYSKTFYSPQNPLSSSLTLEQLYLVWYCFDIVQWHTLIPINE